MTFLAHHFWIEWGLEKAVRSEQDHYGETFNHSWKECFMRIYCMLPGRWGCTVLRSSKLIVLICWVFCVGRVFLCLPFPEGFRCLVYLPGSRDYLCSIALLIIDGKDKSTHKFHIPCSPFPESEHQKLWLPDPFTKVAAFAGTLVSDLLWEQWPQSRSRAVVRLFFIFLVL